jgi:hypothetical protein
MRRAAIFGVVGLLSCSSSKSTPPLATAPDIVRTHAAYRSAFEGSPSVAEGRRFHSSAELRSTLPSRAVAPLRLAFEDRSELWIELTPIGVVDRTPVPDRGALVFTGVAPSEDLVYVAQRGAVEEFRVLRDANARRVFRWRLSHGAGIGEVAVREGRVEVRDLDGVARLVSEVPSARDARDLELPVTLAVEGDTLVASVDTEHAQYPVVVDPKWTTTTTFGHPSTATGGSRYDYALLSGDKVMFVGGMVSPNKATAAATIYDANTDKWTVADSMATPRMGPIAIHLASGGVLVTGGFDESGNRFSSAEEYVPATASWKTSYEPAVHGPNLNYAPAIGQLSDGKVLVIGGLDGTGGQQTAADVYDPSTGTWTALPSKPEFAGAGVLIPFAGGKALYVNATAKAFVYTSSTSTFTAVADMPDTLAPGGTALIGNDPVIATGGYYSGKNFVHRFRTATSTWDTPIAGPSVAGNVTAGVAFSSTQALFVYAQGAGPGSSLLYTDGPSPLSLTATADTYPIPRLVALSGGRALGAAGNVVDIFRGESLGSSCAAGDECASGNCVDGVCCDTSCAGTCKACDVSGKLGTCSLVTGAPHGTRPACGGTGSCAGSCDGVVASCSFPGSTTVCSTAGCSAGKETSSGSCDGTGACGAPAAKTCAPYACGATACKSTCASDADCDATAYCVGTSCVVGKKPDGHACGVGSECSSTFCEGGVCCDKACGGACQACGTGTCTPNSATTKCDTTCSGASVTISYCSGTDGTCKPSGVATACAQGLLCADATSCKSSCGSSADCADPSASCVAGACVVDAGVEVMEAGPAETGSMDADALPPGTPDDEAIGKLVSSPSVAAGASFQRCASNSECPSSFCVEGVCCNTECKDLCHSCALPSAPGICTLSPAGVDFRGQCGVPGTCTATCDGKGACVGATVNTVCDRNRCSDTTHVVGAATCASAGGDCRAPSNTAYDCAPYTCVPALGACLTSCRSSEDCARGSVCDTASTHCVEVPAESADSGCAITNRRTSSTTPLPLFLALVLAWRRRALR